MWENTECTLFFFNVLESPKTPDRSTVTHKTTVTVPMSSTTHVPTTSPTTTTSSTSTELPSTLVPSTTTVIVGANSLKSVLYRRTTASTKVTTDKPFENTTNINGNADKLNTIKTEEKTNVIIIFVLSTALIVALTVCIVFLIAWRKTARELRKQRDDVYFFHKSVRQELSNKTPGLPEPVYAHISSTPEPPPRTPPLTPLSPDFLLRSVSLSSETPLKETDFDAQSRHDYLQLM